MEFKPSDKLIEHIKKSEDFRAKPYNDRGKPAIGYGQRNFDQSIKEVTKEQADKMLRDHLAKLSGELKGRIQRENLTQGQIDSIFDAAYNIGTKKLQSKYKFFDRINSGNDDDIANFYRTAVKGAKIDPKTGKPVINPKTGKVELEPLKGLIARGQQRAAWWTGKEQSGNPVDVAVSNTRSGIQTEAGGYQATVQSIIQQIGGSDLTEQGTIETPEQPEQPEQKETATIPQTSYKDIIGSVISKVVTDIEAKGPEENTALKLASDVYDAEEFDYVNQAERLARQTGMSVERASAELSEYSYDDVLVRSQADGIKNTFPVLSKFASEPRNYPLILRDLEGAKKLELATKPLRKPDIFDDLEKAFYGPNKKMALDTLNTLQWSLGLKDTSEFLRDRKAIESSNEPQEYFYQKQVDRLQEIYDRERDEVKLAIEKLGEPVNYTGAGMDIDYIKRNIQVGLIKAESLIDQAIGIYENPKGFAIRGMQSIAPSLTSYAAALLGGVGGAAVAVYTTGPASLLTGPPAIAVGAKSASAISTYAMTAAEYINGDIDRAQQEYMNDETLSRLTRQNTGKEFILDERFRTPEREEIRLLSPRLPYINNPEDFDVAQYMESDQFAEAQKAAFLIYAPTQAGFDYVTMGLLGKFSKFGGKTKGPVRDGVLGMLQKFGRSKVGQVSGSFIKEGSAQFAGEFAQQGTSRYLSNLYQGRTSPLDNAEMFMEASDEAFSVFGPSGAIGTSVGGAKYILSKSYKQYKNLSSGRSELVDGISKATTHVKEAYKSLRDHESIMQAAEAVRNFKGKEFVGKTKSYVQELLKKNKKDTKLPPIPTEEDLIRDGVIDDERIIQDDIDREMVNANKEVEDSVKVDSRLITAMLTTMNIGPDDFFTQMSPEMVKQYKAALKNETYVNVPKADWIIAIAEFPELNAVAKVGGNKYTAVEAEDLAASISQDPTVLMGEEFQAPDKILDEDGGVILKQEEPPKEGEDETVEGDEPPPIPTEQIEPPPIPTEQIEPPPIDGIINEAKKKQFDPPTVEELEQEEGDINAPILRRVALRTRFKNQDEIDAFKTLTSQLKAATNKKWIPVEAIEFVAEIQFQHIKNRAENTGRAVKEIADENFFRPFRADEYRDPDKAYTKGYMQPTPGMVANTFIAIRKKFKTSAGTKARINTVVHELGHLWLDEMSADWNFIHSIPEDKLTHGQREYKFAMQEIAKQYGYADLKWIKDVGRQVKSSKENREKLKMVHESFAQTAEKYFLEGNFNGLSKSMRRVLEGLRRYMRRFAEIVASSYPQYPALKIDQNINRVFSAIIGASQEIDKQAYAMFPNADIDAELLGRGGEDILDAIRDSYDSTVAEVYGRVFNQKLKDHVKLMQEFERQAYEEAEDNLKNTKISLTRRAFDEAAQKRKDGEITEEHRLNFDSVAAMIFEGDAKKMMEWKKSLGNRFIAGKNKKADTTAESFMEAMGIRDGEELKKVLEDADNLEFFIEQEAERILEEMNPPVKTDEEIHEIVVDELSKIDRAQILKKSYVYMATKAQKQLKKLVSKGVAVPARFLQKRMDKDSLNIKAERIISNTKWNHSKAEDFLKESEKWGETAAVRFDKNQFLAALEAKEQQAIYYTAFQKAQKYRKEALRTRLLRDTLIKANRKKIAGKFDVEIVEYLTAIRPLTDPAKKDAIKYDNILSKIPRLNINNLSFGQFVSEDQVDRVNSLLKVWTDAVEGKFLSDMTVADYQKLMDFNRAVIRLAKNARTLRKMDKEVDAIRVRDGVLNKIDVEKLKKSSNLYTDYARNNNATPDSLIRAAMGDEEYYKSEFADVYEGYREQAGKMGVDYNEFKNKLSKKLKEIEAQDAETKGLKETLISFIPFSRKPKAIKSEVLNYTFKNGIYDILGILAYMGSSANREVLFTNGIGKNNEKIFGDYMPFDDNSRDEMNQKVYDFFQEMADKGVLKKAHFELVQEIFNELEKLYPKVKEAILDVDGYEMGNIEATPIETPFGTFKGGYYPLRYDSYSRRGTETRKRVLNEFHPANDDSMYVPDFYPAQNRGMSYTRTTTDSGLKIDFGAATYAVMQQYKIAYLRQPLESLGKVLGDIELLKTLDSAFEKDETAKNIIKFWYDRQIQHTHVDVANADAADGIANYLLRGAYMSTFVGNLGSGFTQFVGLTSAMQFASKKGLGVQFGNNLKMIVTNPKSLSTLTDRISSVDPIMADRFKNHAKNYTRGVERLKFGRSRTDDVKKALASVTPDYKLLQKMVMADGEEVTYWIMQSGQNIVDVSIYDAVFTEEMKKGRGVKTATRLARRAVEASQGTNSIYNITRAKWGNAFKKIWVSFTTPILAQQQRGLEIYSQIADLPVEDQLKTIVPWLGLVAVAPGILLAMKAQALYGVGEYDEDDSLFERMMKDYAHRGFEETLQVFSPVAGPMVYEFAVKDRLRGSPIVDIITRDLKQARNYVENVGQDVPVNKREIQGLLDSLTVFSLNPTFSLIGKGYGVLDTITKDEYDKKMLTKERRRAKKQARRE